MLPWKQNFRKNTRVDKLTSCFMIYKKVFRKSQLHNKMDNSWEQYNEKFTFKNYKILGFFMLFFNYEIIA